MPRISAARHASTATTFDRGIGPLPERPRQLRTSNRAVRQCEQGRHVMSKNSKNMKIVSFDGPPCPRCGCPTEIREHERITEKELARPFYYSRWYNCRNEKCQTNIIHADEFKVRIESKAQRPHDTATTTERRNTAEWQVRRIPPDKCPSPATEPDAVFVKNGFKASLCLECAHVDLIRANEDHRPCTLCGAKPSLP
jgi:hypothetical protein